MTRWAIKFRAFGAQGNLFKRKIFFTHARIHYQSEERSRHNVLNMKLAFLILIILISSPIVTGQATSSVVAITTIYSQDGKFYLKSVPYDNEFPSLIGKTSVYATGNPTPLYVFERGFDSVEEDSNNLILSNNGEIIFYAIPWGADEEKAGLKSITIYKHGKILRSFTETEITGCNKNKERCSLVYSNYDAVVDRDKSNWGTRNYKKVFKAGVDEKEQFLSNFPIFSFEDRVYLTDSKKQVHVFALKEGSYIGGDSFDQIFQQIKDKGRFNRAELNQYEAPIFLNFPNLKNGMDTYQALASAIGMKPASITTETDQQFKIYSFKITPVLSQDGSLDIEESEFFDELPKEKILEFFKTHKFDVSAIPRIFDKWKLGEEYFYFRNPNDRIARQEKQREILEERKELEKHLTLERINDIYIPQNLGECFPELDKLLPEIDKKEMQALPKRDDMIQYHLALGMWMRNNWRLWGGSRLQKYFTDRGITHPEEMSSIVLYHYHDWLNGKKETWKEWETQRKAK